MGEQKDPELTPSHEHTKTTSAEPPSIKKKRLEPTRKDLLQLKT